MPALADIAARSVGASSCVKILKVPEGKFNKTFILTMDDGREVIAKLPNPNAGHPHFTTASEVASMVFVKNILDVPAPRIFAWSSRIEKNPVGAEYIIMEKMPGIELEKVWDDMPGRQKYEVVKQLVDMEQKFATTFFMSFGSLYYTQDLPRVDSDGRLCVTEDGSTMQCSQFAVGPSTSRMFFDHGRANVDVDRGPWHSIEDYAAAAARRESACIKELSEFPMPQGLFYGPGQYRLTPEYKLSVLNDYSKVLKYLLPKDETFRRSILWHSDLHPNNIFVNPDKPTEILGIIDWQSIHLSPFFLQARNPALIDFDGPIPEGLDPIELPNDFDHMNAEEQKKAKLLRSAQSLYKLYEVQLRRRNKHVLRALQYCETLPCQITGVSGSLFTDGEPMVHGMLIAVERDWSKIVGEGPDGRASVPCPISFSEQDKALQADHEAQWTKGVELMQSVLQYLGAYPGWDGWVNDEGYETMKARLQECLAQFLEHEAKNEEERAAWIAAWPFTDQAAKSRIYPRIYRYKPPRAITGSA
ncbi:MAG: hypothetical protein Q9208_008359 [Pyrenodesmia sp. 3 TL-2023]